jgi:hypothetical protein
MIVVERITGSYLLSTADGYYFPTSAFGYWLYALNMHWSCVAVALNHEKGFLSVFFHISLSILEINLILLCNCIYLCKTVSLITSVNKLFKSSVLWGILWCSPLKVSQCFRGTCHFHLQGWRKAKQETGMNQAVSRASPWFLVWLTLRPWRWKWRVSVKCQLTFNGLHHIISQNTEIFIPTAVKTSNSTINCWFLLLLVNLIRRTDSWCNFAKPWLTVRLTLLLSSVLQLKLYKCAWDIKQRVLKVKTLVVPSL